MVLPKFPSLLKKTGEKWWKLILQERQSLALVIFILDIRRDPSEDDLSLRDWLEHYRIPYLYVLTKADKLSNNQSVSQRSKIERDLHAEAGRGIILFSAKTEKGKNDIWQVLEDHLRLPERK